MKKCCIYLMLSSFLLLISTISANNIIAADDVSEEDFFKVEEQLVVTASKRAQKISEAPATVYVISDKEIEQYGLVDLKDALKLIPGMIVEDGSYGQLYGGQRGFTGVFQKTLLMINGREVNNLIANEAFIGPQFPLHNVKRIEVIAGPGSALYGANAFAGVINIITKTAEEINGAEVSYTYSDEMRSDLVTLSYGKKTDKCDVVVNARVKKGIGYDFSDYVSDLAHLNPSVFNSWTKQSDGTYMNGGGQIFRTPNTSGDRYENPEDVKYYDVLVNYKLNKKNLKEVFAGLNMYDMTTGHGMTKTQWLYHGGYDHREQYLYFAGVKSNFLDNKLETKLEARYTKEYTWGNHTSTDAIRDYPGNLSPDVSGNAYWWGSGTILADDDNDPSTPYLPTKSDIERMRGWWSNRKSEGLIRKFIELQWNYNLNLFNKSNQLVGGFVYDRKEGENNPWSLAWASGDWGRVDNDMHPDFPDYDKRDLYKQTKKAFYLQDQLNFLDDKLLTTIGFRYDHHKNDAGKDYSYGGIFNPRLGLIYKLSDAHTFKVLYGSAFREASPFEDPSLKPEEMKTYEIGYIFKKEKLAKVDKLENQINFYINKAKNYIVNEPRLEPGSGRFVYAYSNAGEVEVFGFENIFRIEPNKKLRLDLVYTYQSPKQKIGSLPEVDVDNIPRNQANMRCSWNLWKNINIGWISRWSDKITTTRDQILQDGDSSNPIREIKSYTVHDMTILAKRVLGSDKGSQLVDLSLTIQNLFDKKYDNSNNRFGYGSFESASAFGQPGRVVYLKATSKF